MVSLLLCSMNAVATPVDGRSLLIGITIDLGVYTYQGTRNKVVLPTVHVIQRTIRPIPQDKIDRAEAKRRKLEARQKAKGK